MKKRSVKTPPKSKYPTLFRIVYRSNNYLKAYILTLGTKTQLLLLIPLIFILHIVMLSIIWTAWYTGLTISSVFGLSKFLDEVIKKFCRNTGTKDRFIFSGEHLIKEDATHFVTNLSSFDSDRFTFATPADANLSAKLNIKGYRYATNHLDGAKYRLFVIFTYVLLM